jgi:hypothetical protein
MMAFAQQFVVSVLSNNKVVREVNDHEERVCNLPFESEYKLRLQNKTSKRAMATVEIDGMDINPGRRFILAPGEKIDLERFLLDGNPSVGRKFKFTSLAQGAVTGEIQDPTSPDNGKVRVTFYPEEEWGTTILSTLGGCSCGPHPLHGHNFFLHNPITSTDKTWVGDAPHTPFFGGVQFNSVPQDFLNAPSSVMNCATPVAMGGTVSGEIPGLELERESGQAGATAEGGISNQKFQDVTAGFKTADPVVLEIRLRGPSPKKPTTSSPSVSSPWSVKGTYPGKPVSVFYLGAQLGGLEEVGFDSTGALCLRIRNYQT